jgi:hypothetical protein
MHDHKISLAFSLQRYQLPPEGLFGYRQGPLILDPPHSISNDHSYTCIEQVVLFFYVLPAKGLYCFLLDAAGEFAVEEGHSFALH